MPEMFIKPKLAERTGDWTTIGNAYVVVPDGDTELAYHKVKGYKNKLVELICTLNTLKFKIDASLDASSWHNIKAETTLAVGSTFETNNEPWNYLRVQIKPTVADAHGTMAVTVKESSL